jgi:hypothetical protein
VAPTVGGAGRHSMGGGGGKAFCAGCWCNAEVRGKPSVVTGTAEAAGRWGVEKGTPPCTSVGHCWMRLPWPSSSCLPCSRASYHP